LCRSWEGRDRRSIGIEVGDGIVPGRIAPLDQIGCGTALGSSVAARGYCSLTGIGGSGIGGQGAGNGLGSTDLRALPARLASQGQASAFHGDKGEKWKGQVEAEVEGGDEESELGMAVTARRVTSSRMRPAASNVYDVSQLALWNS